MPYRCTPSAVPVGHDYVRYANDDRTRIADAEIHPDECSDTGRRTPPQRRYVGGMACTIQRVITDNPLACRRSAPGLQALIDVAPVGRLTRAEGARAAARQN